MGRVTTADVSVFSVGSVDLLALLKNARIVANIDQVDGKPFTRLGKSAHAVKKSLEISYSNFSTVSAPQRVTNINVTAFSYGGTDYIGTLRSGTFSGEFTHVEGSGIGDVFKSPYVTEKDYKLSAELQLVDSATANWWQNNADELLGGNLTGVNITVSFTINSVAITMPMSISSAELVLDEGGLQTVRIECSGRSPDSGDYPTAPTGTTSLFEKALNAPKTALAYSITNAATSAYDVNLAGNCIIKSFSIGFQDGALVMEDYSYASQGTVTPSV